MPDVHALPKAELHIHVEGSLEPELVFSLARRNGVQLPWASVEQLQAEKEFTDLQSFLDLYYSCMSVLRTVRDFRDLAHDYFRRAYAQGVHHAELFFDPQAHTTRGVLVDDVIDGLLEGIADAEEELGVSGGLILCILRDRPVEEALDTLESVRHRADELIGIGLDSAELGHPPALFAEVYERAAAMGLHLVAHAGEEGPADYVRQALDVLHVERIDHGVRSMDDPQLVKRLAEERIPLTVCPLSNKRLRVTPDLAEHPLKRMLDAGIVATVNSDDPAYFGGYAGDNFAAIRDALALTTPQLRLLAENSVLASFAGQRRKSALLAQIAAWGR